MRFKASFILLLLILLFSCAAQAQSKASPGSLYDDEHLKSWATDFLAGNHDKVIKAVEENLTSPSPHPFAAHVWTVTQDSLGRLEQAYAEIKDEKLKKALDPLPDVYLHYQKRSRYLEALNKYPAARAAEIKDYWALSCLTVMAADMDRTLDGLAYALAAVRLLPNSYQMAWLIGTNLLKDQRVWDQVARMINPGGELAGTDVGMYLAKSFRYRPVPSSDQEAKDQISEWLDKHPDDARAWFRRGLVAAALGKSSETANKSDEASKRYKEAADYFKRALNLYPFKTRTLIYWNELVAAYIKTNQLTKVEETLADLGKIEKAASPDVVPVPLQVKMTALRKAGNLKEAKDLATLMQHTYPKDGGPSFELAELAKVEKKDDEVIKFSREAIEKSPDELDYRNELMGGLTNAGKWQEAIDLVNDTEKREIKPDASLYGNATWAYRVLIYRAQHPETGTAASKEEEFLTEKAFQMMRRAVATYPESSSVLREQAALLISADKPEAALASLNHAFEITAPAQWSIDRLGEILSATNSSHTDAVGSVIFSPDGKKVLTRSDDLTLRLWDVASGKALWKVKGAKYFGAFSTDGQALIINSGSTNIKLLDAATGKEIKQFGVNVKDYPIGISPDRKKVLVQGSNGITVWDLESAGKLFTIDSTSNYTNTAIFSPDGKLIGTGDKEGMVACWDAETGKELKKFDGASEEISDLAFSPDGKLLLAGSADETARLWDIETTTEIGRFEGHSGIVYTVAFSPDGKTIATGGEDQTVRLWSLATQEQLSQFNDHADAVYAVAFSPDGKTLATASKDKTARILDAATLKPILTLGGQTADPIIASLLKRFPYARDLMKEVEKTEKNYSEFAKQQQPDLPDLREYEKRGAVRNLRFTPGSFDALQFELKNNYPDGSAVLYYAYKNEKLYIWLFDATGPRAYWQQPLSETKLKAVLQTYENVIGRSSQPGNSARHVPTDATKSSDADAREALQRSLLELSDIFLPREISQSTGQVKHLIVVPLPEARSIPYAALQPFKDDQYLIDRMSVSLALNLADVGNYVEPWQSNFAKPLVVDLNSSSTVAAQYNRDEAQAFAAISKAERIGAANKEALIDKVADADLLYISADEFAGPRNANGEYNFMLSLPNQLKESWSPTQDWLTARLAFLSIGQPTQEKTGAERRLDFAREFQRAGVPRVITVLWGIPHDARRSLMCDIANNLQKQEPWEAVRTTILKFKLQNRDPRAWSSLVLLGTPRLRNIVRPEDDAEEIR